MRWVGKCKQSKIMLDTTMSCQPLPKIPFVSKEVSRKMLKVDKVAFWVAFFSVYRNLQHLIWLPHHRLSNGGTWYCERSNNLSLSMWEDFGLSEMKRSL